MDWRRPHPLTLITLAVQALSQTIFPLIIIFGGSSGGGGFFSRYGESVFFVVPLGLALARWYSTRYAIDDEAVYLNSGIFKRTKQVLPRANVQNLSTTAPLLARATGLVELNISDASADGDIKLRLVEKAEAERLTTLLRAGIRQRLETQEDSSEASVLAPPTVHASGREADAQAIVKSTTAELAQAALATSANGLVPAGLLGIWLAGLNWANEGFIGDLLPSQMPAWGWLLIVVTAVIAVAAITVLTRVITMGGFRLWDDPDRLRMKAGLLTERQITARRERIQLVKVNRPLVLRRLGMEEIRFSTADVEAPQLAGMTVLNPAAQLGAWIDLAPRALGTVELNESALTQVSPLTQRRMFIRFLVAAIGVALASVIAGVLWSELMIVTGLVVAIAVAATGWVFAKRRYERLGFAVGQTQILTRVGVLNEQLTLMRKEKVQGIVVSSTFFQRRLGLATLSVGTAGHGGQLGGLRLPDLPASKATELSVALAHHSALTPLKHTL
jgi:putative membrane protein